MSTTLEPVPGIQITMYGSGDGDTRAELHAPPEGLRGLTARELMAIANACERAAVRMMTPNRCCNEIHATALDAMHCPGWGMNRSTR